jgi:hypothetical protein
LGVAFDNDSVYLALSCGAEGETNSLTLDLYLMTQHVVPQSAAPVLHLSLHNGTAQATLNGANTLLADGDFELVSKMSDNAWSAEGRVELGRLVATEGGTPVGPWRLNAVLRRVSENSAPEIVARWGFPNEQATLHGAVIRFEE